MDNSGKGNFLASGSKETLPWLTKITGRAILPKATSAAAYSCDSPQ
jgi:hypothetical protein